MKMTVTIDMNTAAFEESACLECCRILRDLANTIPLSDFNEPFDRKLTLRDYNGNKVGEMRVTA